MGVFMEGYASAIEVLGAAGEGLRDRRILVTGATGFIGGHVVELLHHLGADVHAVARQPGSTVSFDTPVTWHRADLTDAAATAEAVKAVRPEMIVHLAGLVKGARDPDLLLPMFAANTASAVHLLDAARRFDVARVLLAGSLEEPDEPAQLAASPYALSKAAAHLYGDYYRATTAVEVVNLQIFMVYGPAQLDEAKLIPYVIRSLQAGEAPSLSTGTRLVDWVYVGDVAEGIARACVGAAAEHPVPLGTGSLATVRDVVETMIDLAEVEVEPRFGCVADRSREVEKVADIDTTRQLLGWVPAVDLREGLAATLSWYGGA
ncbi:MAG: NAD-dependent epimerase/dehydratase family protein [Acidimicrobiia bacterium]|nr:NAD-dependent epimerase/dehydratase family protein [Acidimicrobiia bacterium]